MKGGGGTISARYWRGSRSNKEKGIVRMRDDEKKLYERKRGESRDEKSRYKKKEGQDVGM